MYYYSSWLDRHSLLRSLQSVNALEMSPSVPWTITSVWLPFMLAFVTTIMLFLIQTNFFPTYVGYLNVVKATAATLGDAIPSLVIMSACSEFISQVSPIESVITKKTIKVTFYKSRSLFCVRQ